MPEQLHRHIRDATGAGKPFERQIDAWWLAISVGVKASQRRPMEPGAKTTKFMDGTIFGRDPWRIVHLELLALATEGEEVLRHPTKVIAIASSYANYGLEWLINECLIGDVEPSVTILNRLDPAALG
ncbi:hypothetical protein [Catellatospora sp. TT07R-123]|uniref:hypothetical protein n=1 Tax=Catellatospora sp. TT07R-123 TaxID=2733863 RepID=UPI001BB34ECD|nr:hypothetical protein [Catellatospora sp. TT07R-123]